MIAAFSVVVIHSISTSNHNEWVSVNRVNEVVIHSISTSNHNLRHILFIKSML